MNSKSIYTPYTYLLGWSKLNKWYYGGRWAKESNCLYETGCHPDDFWKTYFTSSKPVDDFIIKHGQPDVIQIRKTFNNADDCIEWESKVLKSVKAAQRETFLNGCNVRGFIPYKTEEHKRNISISNSKPKTGIALEACRNNFKIASELRRGQKDSEETKRKRNESLRKAFQEPGFKQKHKFTLYSIDGIEYIGQAEIMSKYNISRTTLWSRCKDTKWDWHKMGTLIK
jgi:hypothetical protein